MKEATQNIFIAGYILLNRKWLPQSWCILWILTDPGGPWQFLVVPDGFSWFLYFMSVPVGDSEIESGILKKRPHVKNI